MKSQINEHQKDKFKIVGKKIKALVLLVAISVATFYSCTDNNPIEDEAVTQGSTALRTAMNELKIANDISDNRLADAATSSPFCFSFVYPLTLSYNTGTTVTVTSLQGLLGILASETPNLYVSGISFPFQVMQNGVVSTISTEGQFISLLMGCGYNTLNTDLLNSMCFDIVYPVTVADANGQNITITSAQGLMPYLNNPGNGQVQFVYPISVAYDNQIVVVDNIYELYQMINNCDDCVCTMIYQPVCVLTPTGVVEFGNFCFAQCAGFTQNDLVSCNPTGSCNITNLTATPGACNPNAANTHALTINFSYVNAPGTTFEVRNNANQLVGTYPLSSLPLTINNFDSTSGSAVWVTLGNNCSEMMQYTAPNCNNCACPTDFNPVCVQTPTGTVQYSNACVAICAGHSQNDFVTCPSNSNFATQLGSCFFLTYPVQVQHQGQVVTVNNNSQLLQYYFPSQSPIPAFVYPVTATFANQVVTIQSQSAFQSFIQANCN